MNTLEEVISCRWPIGSTVWLRGTNRSGTVRRTYRLNKTNYLYLLDMEDESVVEVTSRQITKNPNLKHPLMP